MAQLRTCLYHLHIGQMRGWGQLSKFNLHNNLRKNNSGPNIDPWGIPVLMLNICELDDL